MTDQEHFRPRSKKVRGVATRSLDLIDAMVVIAAQTRPGIAYKMFARGLIPSMETKPVRAVYRLLKIARETGRIPWSWIVDETARSKVSTWNNPELKR